MLCPDCLGTRWTAFLAEGRVEWSSCYLCSEPPGGEIRAHPISKATKNIAKTIERGLIRLEEIGSVGREMLAERLLQQKRQNKKKS